VWPLLPSWAEHGSPARAGRGARARPRRGGRAASAPHGDRRSPTGMALRKEHRRAMRRARRLCARALSLRPLRRSPRRLPDRRAGLPVVSRGAKAGPPGLERRVRADSLTRAAGGEPRPPLRSRLRLALELHSAQGGSFHHAIELARSPRTRRSHSGRVLVRRDGRLGERNPYGKLEGGSPAEGAVR
jgi:hypothetical protein